MLVPVRFFARGPLSSALRGAGGRAAGCGGAGGLGRGLPCARGRPVSLPLRPHAPGPALPRPAEPPPSCTGAAARPSRALPVLVGGFVRWDGVRGAAPPGLDPGFLGKACWAALLPPARRPRRLEALRGCVRRLQALDRSSLSPLPLWSVRGWGCGPVDAWAAVVGPPLWGWVDHPRAFPAGVWAQGSALCPS